MLSWASRTLGVVGRGLQGVGRGRPAVCTGVWRASSSGGGDGRVRTDGPVVVSSPHSGVNIPDSVSVAEFVMDKLAQYGERTALVDGVTGEETSYGQLITKITRVSSSLVKSGLRKGDVVTLFSPNCPEFAITYLAVAAMGGIVSAVNPVYTAGELKHTLSHSGSRLLVTAPSLVDVARKAVPECPNLMGIVVFGNVEGCRPFKDLLDDDGTMFPENLDFDAKEDLVALPYSSGTTGLPKGVMLSQYNIVANLTQISNQDVLPHGTEDSLIGVLPFFHIYGQVIVMLNGLIQGAKISTVPHFEPATYLKLIESQRATFLHVVPPILLLLSQHPLVAQHDLGSVSGFMCAAAPVGEHVVQSVVDRIGHAQPIRAIQGYGLTETSPLTHCNPPVGFEYSSIGVPVHNTESKIVDVSSGETLGHGHEGEIWVRGPQVMKGYFKNEKATAETITNDRWLRTGDIGYSQPSGHFYITDRLKELIKVKGFQVAPAELEALLLQQPAVQDCAVIGIPDERAGELPRAYIVLKPNTKATEDDIKEFIKKQVAPFKQLSGGVEFIQEVPKSASGKILRRHLKTAYLAQ